MSGRVFCSLAQTYVILLLMMNPLFFSFFSVFTEKTQLSHVSEVKYFLINLLLMMFWDCKFPVKFHFVWFVCSNLCSISFVFGKPCKSPGTWASPGLFVICFY